MSELRFETRAIHAGQDPDPRTGAVAVPVYQTSTYAQEALGRHKGYEYSRTQNPTREALEACLAALEGGRFGLAFASGMAATNTVLNLLTAGDHVVCSDDVYGGTYRIFERVYRGYGLGFSYVDTRDPQAIEAALRPETRLVWIETPSNPLLKLTDLAAVAALCRARGLISVVDNTFATPVFQRPLEHGIDLVAHSTTKYLGGHSDVVGGALVTSREDLHARLRFCQNAVGAVPGPWDAWLVNRGLKTLAVRMARHAENAVAIARFLAAHREVERVRFPFLESDPQHALARRQMSGAGGMVSFEIRGGLEAARGFLARVRLFTLAESLGGVESLIEHPALMTHASIPPAVRAASGVSDSLIRLSVGIEHVDDLIADLEQAFGARP